MSVEAKLSVILKADEGEVARLRQASSGDDAIVLRVRPDPEPQDPICGIHGKGTVVRTHADGVKPPDALEVQRRMSHVGLQKLELPVG